MCGLTSCYVLNTQFHLTPLQWSLCGALQRRVRFSPIYQFTLVSIIPSIPLSHISFTYHRRHTILAIGTSVNPLNPKLNPICYLLALLRAHHFLHVRRIRVKLLTFRLLMSYIYGAPILDVSRSHTTTQHSR